MRKLLKPRRPCKSQSRGSKKTVAERRDEDTETVASDGGTPCVGQDSRTSTPAGNVSSATKLKLAAFSASEVGMLITAVDNVIPTQTVFLVILS